MEQLNALKRIRETIQQLKDELKGAIPKTEHSGVKRLPGNSGAFTLGFKDLMRTGVMSADHYDLPYQANILGEEIDRTEPENVERKLQEILDTGKIRVNARYTLRLHPEFVEKCRIAFNIPEDKNKKSRGVTPDEENA